MDEEERKQWRILFGGTIMTQVAICRFLISKGLIERSELVSWIDAKRQLWEASAGPAGGAPKVAAAAGRCDGQGMETPGVVGNRWTRQGGFLHAYSGPAAREGLAIVGL